MLKMVKAVFFFLVFVASSAQAAKTISALGIDNSGKKIAVVSIAANNWADSLQGWNSADTTELMATRLNTMLEYTEKLLAKDWTVVAAAGFAESAEFQVLAGEQRDVGLPRFGDRYMPLLSKNRKQMVKAAIDKDVAEALAKVTGADYLMIVYSEWAVATGKFVPTSKSLTKNVISIFDAKGKQVYAGRKDTIGDQTIGGVGRVAVNADTIDQWVIAYEKGIDALYGATAQ